MISNKNSTPNEKEKNIIKNVKVEKISVMILGKPGSPPQQLTSDMIIYNNKNTTVLLEKLPFITGSIKYNEKLLLSLSGIYYFKLIEFFFNRNEFEKRCNYMIESGIANYNKNFNSNIENNVRIMMTLLFPTKFPVMRNFNNSFNEFIKKESPSEISYKITFGLSDDSNVVLGNNFSYIKLNEGEYTITKMLWLNDLINHPIYRAFIDEYKDYILKSSERHMNLLIYINNSILKFFNRFDKNEKIILIWMII